MEKPRLVQLISNDDGSLSRTQFQIMFWLIFTMLLIVAHIIADAGWNYKVLTPTVQLTLAVAFTFCFFERMDIRHFNIKVSKDGVQANAGGEKQ